MTEQVSSGVVPTIATAGLGPTGWAIVYRPSAVSVERFEPGSTPDLAGAFAVRAFDGSSEARWWADRGRWATVSAPDGPVVRYRLWGADVSVPANGGSVRLTDQRVGSFDVWLAAPPGATGDRSGQPTLVAREVIASDEFGNCYVADAVLISFELFAGGND